MNDPFSGMKYNPMAVPDKVMIWEHYPDLARRRNLCKVPVQTFEDIGMDVTPEPKDLDLLVKFMTLCCDKNSPFYDEVNWEERKRLCMETIGIQKSSGIAKMVIAGNWWFNTVMGDYLNLSANDLFSSWLSKKIAASGIRGFMRLSVAEVENPEAHIKAAIIASNQIDEMDRQIAALEIRLFPASEMAIAALDAATADEIGSYAEKYAVDFFKEDKHHLPPV